jgi:hypothetical protein
MPDLIGLACPREAFVSEPQLEASGHPMVIDDAPHTQGDSLGTLQAAIFISSASLARSSAHGRNTVSMRPCVSMPRSHTQAILPML